MKWIHNLLKCFSFSAVLFTFEACYGCPADGCYDYQDFSVLVIDNEGNGIQNVEIRVTNVTDGDTYVDTTSLSGLAYIEGFFNGKKIDVYCNPLEGVDFQPKDTCLNWHGCESVTITLDRK